MRALQTSPMFVDAIASNHANQVRIRHLMDDRLPVGMFFHKRNRPGIGRFFSDSFAREVDNFTDERLLGATGKIARNGRSRPETFLVVRLYDGFTRSSV